MGDFRPSQWAWCFALLTIGCQLKPVSLADGAHVGEGGQEVSSAEGMRPQAGMVLGGAEAISEDSSSAQAADGGGEGEGTGTEEAEEAETTPCALHSECPPSQACASAGVCEAVVPLNIVTMTLESVARGAPYDQVLEVRGGAPPIVWRMVEGPDWLTLDDEGHLRSAAVPGPPAVHTVEVVATDDLENRAEEALTLVVTDACAELCEDPVAPQQQMDCTCGCSVMGPCPAGQLCCDGRCIDPQSNAGHCGRCSRACAAPANGVPTCTAGECVIGCQAGYADCDLEPDNGCEADLDTELHCGSCNNDCAAQAYPNGSINCIEGACAPQCNAGFEDCDGDVVSGCEVDTRVDTTHCGACDEACTLSNADVVCGQGACRIAACELGFDNCNGAVADGCETPLGTADDCNACGDQCFFGTGDTRGRGGCVDGECVLSLCTFPYSNCDGRIENGCETDSRTSPADCGQCGRACGPSASIGVIRVPAQACESSDCCAMRGGLCRALGASGLPHAECCAGTICRISNLTSPIIWQCQ